MRDFIRNTIEGKILLISNKQTDKKIPIFKYFILISLPHKDQFHGRVLSKLYKKTIHPIFNQLKF